MIFGNIMMMFHPFLSIRGSILAQARLRGATRILPLTNLRSVIWRRGDVEGEDMWTRNYGAIYRPESGL